MILEQIQMSESESSGINSTVRSYRVQYIGHRLMIPYTGKEWVSMRVNIGDRYLYDQNVEVSSCGFTLLPLQGNQNPDRKIVLVGVVKYEEQFMEKDNVCVVK